VRRAFNHRAMKDVCGEFARGTFSKGSGTIHLVALPLEAPLRDVAAAFVALQEARHNADYDVSSTLTKLDALQKIALARTAFTNWQAVRRLPNARVFLAALLLQRQWRG
jgi:hypothetical protein